MDFTSEWIVPLTESCLQSFTHGSVSGIERKDVRWQDDGSSIRFFKYKTTTETQALISNLTENEKPLRATLMDPRNQIEATLTRDALQRYRNEYPDRVLSKNATRGYPMTLLDFEVVFEYSASKPEVHFYVKDFRIDWNHGRRNSSVPKKVSNDPRVFKLLQAAFTAAKERRGGGDSAALVDGNQSDASVSSQGNINIRRGASKEILPDSGISQEAFASQVPTLQQPTALGPSPTGDPDTFRKTAELLVHLGSCQKGPDDDTAASANHMDRQGVNRRTSPRPAAGHEGQQLCNNLQESNNIGNPLGLADDQAHRSVAAPEIVPSCTASLDMETNGCDSNADFEALTAKIGTEKDVNGSVATRESREFASEPPIAKRHRIEDTGLQIDIGTSKRTETINSHNHLNHDHPDPWNGMTKIEARDIRIPGDQKSLLESKRQWIPPPPGMDLPRGHVPPSLLDQWNKVVAQRNSSTQKEPAGHEIPGTPNCEISPSRSSSTQSDAEESVITWPPSDRDNELPADSSPIRARVSRRTKSPSANRGNADGSQLPRDIEHKIAGNTRKYHRVDHEEAAESDALAAASLSNQDLVAVTPPEPSNKGCAERPGRESDGDSDFEMDTSIPSPLGLASQQAQRAGLSERFHSCPALPDRVQVIETPAANHAQLRSKSVTINSGSASKGGRARSSQERSSQAGKWCSQSQVADTYGDNHHEAVGYRYWPQGSLDEAGSFIDVIGTQEASGESQQTLQTTSHSQSGVVLDSSEDMHHNENTNISSSAPQAVASQLFSPACEVPFSQSDTGSHGLGIYSSSKETHSQDGPDNAQAPALKRSAPEIEDGSPPSKRHKPAVHENDLSGKRAVGALDSDTATRGQSHSRGSSVLPDAARAHEKFRSDYPSYSGDFAHFTELCHKLQRLRAGGKLPKSSLWDDFIIIHLQEYPAYLEKCRGAGAKSQEYEEYFTSTLPRVLHKRRNLTARTIELCAAHYAPVDQSSRPPSLTSVRDGGDILSVHSPVGKISHSCTHPHESAPSVHSDPDADHLPTATLSPSHGNRDMLAHEPESEGLKELSSGVKIGPPTSSFEGTGLEAKQEDSESGSDSSGTDDEMDLDVKMEKVHDTLSIELGEEGDPPSSPCGGLDNEFERSNEPESINENWFVSLRHIRPTGPVWSDDRNTPFKAWARADLNVASERALRGGRYLAVDDHGVVQRTTTSP